ncbi:MAG: exonuclease domain-containing protein [Flaviflexus sp.]|nr:exonuclease domain-containing protein [Flaviflexus sp.]
MEPWVAIDFETANEKRASACSIGLVAFDARGEIEARYSTLLRPHAAVDWFNPRNIGVHGISSLATRAAPTWDEVAGEIVDFIGARPLVAHNMGFDGSVLNGLTDLYGGPLLANKRMCTLRLARRLLAGRVGKMSLDTVFDYYFPGEVFSHHRADADAEACGRIFARMQSDYGFGELERLCPPSNQRRRTST